MPLLLEDCRRPRPISGKLYADFRSDYDSGLLAVLKAIVDDKSRLFQIENGFLGLHTDIAAVFLKRLQHARDKVSLNAVFYPLFTFTAAMQSIRRSIENHGCRYEILFLSPTAKCVDEITQIVRAGHTPEQFCQEVGDHVETFRTLQTAYPDHVELRWTDELPTFPMVTMDSRIFVGFFSYAMPAPSGAWMELSTARKLSTQFSEHFAAQWRGGRPVTE